MTYTLNVKETGRKDAAFHYTVTDEAGKIISERKSNRWYVACTIDGQYYFGRLDLIGKGDHGKQVEYCKGRRVAGYKHGKHIYAYTGEVVPQTPIAYLTPCPVS